VEKRNLDSNAAGAHLADALSIRRRLVSHCGLKDRHAVTRQWFSAHLPGQDSPKPSALETDNLRILRVTRNTRKLRRGTHIGNRFSIQLRQPEFPFKQAVKRWQAITMQGVPNIFGPQRFGYQGNNVTKALAMFAGDFETRDRLLRGLLISAARSHLFNTMVAERTTRALWDSPLEGEVYGITSNRSLILPDRQRGDERQRFAQGLIEITAPLWGTGKLQSTQEVRLLEQEIASHYPKLTVGLEACGLKQERRVMRLRPESPSLEAHSNGDIQCTFTLPKGTYATSLLRELAILSNNDQT
jgi:tRNA pseudouridine13 synthase